MNRLMELRRVRYEVEISRDKYWGHGVKKICIDMKGLDPETETGRFKLKTKMMNAHFINELDKIGLQLINIKGSFIGRLVVILEARNLNPTPS
jgi:hypothetical protein